MDPGDHLDDVLEHLNSVMAVSATDLNALEFRRHMQSEDLVGMVLRAHLFVEREITAILKHLLPAPECIEWDSTKWTYWHLVQLLAATNFGGVLQIRAYRNLGKLRNRVAHHLGNEVTETDQTALLDSLDSNLRNAVQVATKGEPFPEPLRTTLILMVVTLSTVRYGFDEAAPSDGAH